LEYPYVAPEVKEPQDVPTHSDVDKRVGARKRVGAKIFEALIELSPLGVIALPANVISDFLAQFHLRAYNVAPTEDTAFMPS
jgi:hypothetical protein